MAKKISIIEDDITMRNLLQTLLQLEGYTVALHMPTSISEVIEQLEQEKPDAILLDVHLKSMNGLEIARQITQHPLNLNPLIIMASGMDLEMECKQAGAHYFLLKPYMPDKLIAWLNESLQ